MKKLYTCRLPQKDLDFIKSNSQINNITHSQLIHNALELYKNGNQLNIEIENKFTNLFYSAYNIILPFTFGSLMTFFYLRNSWFFLLFFVVALIPIILPITKKDINTLVMRF
jgi:hypothetical protein